MKEDSRVKKALVLGHCYLLLSTALLVRHSVGKLSPWLLLPALSDTGYHTTSRRCYERKTAGSEEVEHCFKSSFIIPVKKFPGFLVKLSHPKVHEPTATLGLSC